MGAILGAATPAQAAADTSTASTASVRDQVRDAFTAGAIAGTGEGASAIICPELA